jgi:hypothetical protein
VGQSLSPGNEQRDFWGSAADDTPGSRNTIGIKNPAVDALIDKIIFAKDRETLVAATKALDRVLLWNYYVVPQFTYAFARYARWDRFGRPDPLPKYGVSGSSIALVVGRGEGRQDEQALLTGGPSIIAVATQGAGGVHAPSAAACSFLPLPESLRQAPRRNTKSTVCRPSAI